MRDRAGLVDLSAFAIFDVTGPGAPAPSSSGCASTRSTSRRAGRSTRRSSTAAGGILADLTIMRLAHDRFRVVTGGGMGMRDRKIFQDALPADGSAQLHDADERVHDVRAVGAAGARHPRRGVGRRRRHQPRRLPVPDLEDGRHRRRPDARLADQLRRRARLGDLRPDRAGPAGLGRALARPASRTASSPVGIGTYAVTARLEKGYRAHGAELELDFDLVEAGMARPTVKDADFVGRAAYLNGSAPSDPAAVLCTLTVDDPTSSTRRQALHARSRADPDPRRRAARRREGPPVVRDVSAGSGPSRRQAPPDGVPAAGATRSSARSSSSSTSASATRSPSRSPAARPLFDPENERIRLSAREHPRLRQARAGDRRPDHPHRRRRRRSTPASSASRSARTRSARSRRRSGSSRRRRQRRPS